MEIPVLSLNPYKSGVSTLHFCTSRKYNMFYYILTDWCGCGWMFLYVYLLTSSVYVGADCRHCHLLSPEIWQFLSDSKSPQLYLIGLKVYGFVSKQQTEDKNTVFLGALSWLKSISSRLSWNLISLKNNNKLTTLFTGLMTRSCQSVSYFKYPR